MSLTGVSKSTSWDHSCGAERRPRSPLCWRPRPHTTRARCSAGLPSGGSPGTTCTADRPTNGVVDGGGHRAYVAIALPVECLHVLDSTLHPCALPHRRYLESAGPRMRDDPNMAISP